MIRRTDSVTSHSSVLMWISGCSGASYGAEMPVKSAETSHKKNWCIRLVARRTLDRSSACFLVQTLGVARLHDMQGRIDEHLDEREARIFVQLPCYVAVGAVRRDKGGQSNAG